MRRNRQDVGEQKYNIFACRPSLKPGVRALANFALDAFDSRYKITDLRRYPHMTVLQGPESPCCKIDEIVKFLTALTEVERLQEELTMSVRPGRLSGKIGSGSTLLALKPLGKSDQEMWDQDRAAIGEEIDIIKLPRDTSPHIALGATPTGLTKLNKGSFPRISITLGPVEGRIYSRDKEELASGSLTEMLDQIS